MQKRKLICNVLCIGFNFSLKESGMKKITGILSLFFIFSQLNFNYASARTKFIPYYGKDFYNTKLNTSSPSIPPNTAKKIFQILFRRKHIPNPNGPDDIVKSCNQDNFTRNQQRNCYGQKQLDYSKETRKYIMAVLDSDEIQGTNRLMMNTPYCGDSYQVEKLPGENRYNFPYHTQFNVEHTLPKSFFKGDPRYRMMVADLHNLYAVNSKANSKRGSLNFNDLKKGDDQRISFCNKSKFGYKEGRLYFEPPNEHKGNVARAIFYMVLRYNLRLAPEQRSILLRWHNRDKVDEKERRRVDRAFALQKNRNPFIDFPHLADYFSKSFLTRISKR